MNRDDDLHEDAAGNGQLLIDLLYGEISGEAERVGRARVARDARLVGELEVMAQLRARLHELPDAEPAQAISAQLLHTAAQAAPKSRLRSAKPREADARPGLWARVEAVVALLATHTALAAVTTLVLVVGVAGALLLRNESKVVEPTVASRAGAPEGASLRAGAGETAAQAGDGRAELRADGSDSIALASAREENGRVAGLMEPVPLAPSKKQHRPAQVHDRAGSKDGAARAAAARAQTRRASKLARRGDCGGVDAIAVKVRALDSDVYDTEFVPNQAIAACRAETTKATKAGESAGDL